MRCVVSVSITFVGAGLVCPLRAGQVTEVELTHQVRAVAVRACEVQREDRVRARRDVVHIRCANLLGLVRGVEDRRDMALGRAVQRLYE